MLLTQSFNVNGLLPPGDYVATLEELRNSILVEGAGEDDWDRDWRLRLVNNAEMLIKQLWQVGVSEIFLDGSFVEDKAHPNDIDGYFVCDLREFASGRLQQRLNALDPHKVWTWDPTSRRAYRGFTKKQLPTATAWSCIRTTVSLRAFWMNIGTSNFFLLRSEDKGKRSSRKASSKW